MIIIKFKYSKIKSFLLRRYYNKKNIILISLILIVLGSILILGIGCETCSSDEDCDDHQWCTLDACLRDNQGRLGCVNVPKGNLFCKDDNYCTDDSCDESLDKCVHEGQCESDSDCGRDSFCFDYSCLNKCCIATINPECQENPEEHCEEIIPPYCILGDVLLENDEVEDCCPENSTCMSTTSFGGLSSDEAVCVCMNEVSLDEEETPCSEACVCSPKLKHFWIEDGIIKRNYLIQECKDSICETAKCDSDADCEDFSSVNPLVPGDEYCGIDGICHFGDTSAGAVTNATPPINCVLDADCEGYNNGKCCNGFCRMAEEYEIYC